MDWQQVVVVVQNTQTYTTSNNTFTFWHIWNQRTRFFQVECQYFIRPTFFSWKVFIKYEQLAYSVHLPPCSVTDFPIEETFFRMDCLYPPRQVLHQEDTSTKVKQLHSYADQLNNIYRPWVISELKFKKKITRQTEYIKQNTQSLHFCHDSFGQPTIIRIVPMTKGDCVFFLFFFFRTAVKVPACWCKTLNSISSHCRRKSLISWTYEAHFFNLTSPFLSCAGRRCWRQRVLPS